MFGQRRRAVDPVHHFDAGAQHLKVAVIIEEVRVNQRGGHGVGTGQTHGTATFGAQHADMDRIADAAHRFAAMVFQHRRHKVELDIGHGHIGPRLRKAAGFSIRRGQRAGALGPPLEHRFQEADRSRERRAVEHIPVCLEAGDIVDMVLQV